MADSVREVIRERLSLGAVLFWLVVFGFLFWFFDEPMTQLGTSLAVGAVFGLSDVLIEAYDLRSAVRFLTYGLFALVSAAGWIALSGGGPDMAIVFALAGVWLVLDAVQTIRHEGLKADDENHDSRDGHDVYHEYVVRRVDEQLRERPMTRRELFDVLDADDAAIDRALDTLTERGLLSREGSELRVSSPPQKGPIGRTRDGITAALGRLARPLTIEFENDTADEPRIDSSRIESTADREREPAGRR